MNKVVSGEFQQVPTEAVKDWALGPGSISWKVMRDPTVFMVGQIRTAMLLMMHPPFAASAEHDTFNIDPLLRFRRVGMYAYSTLYGSRADAERLSHMVRTRHGQVKGVEPITKRPYQSNSEYELALTQVIEKSSYLAIYEAIYGPLPEVEKDQFYQEQKVPAAMLGIQPDHLPSSVAETEEFFKHARKSFTVGAMGREILAYYDNAPYPKGTALGDLPWLKGKAALLGSRMVADMALATIGAEDRFIIAINRRPKLFTKGAALASLRLFSKYMRTGQGLKNWDWYLQKRASAIFRSALAVEDAPGYEERKAAFQVPDAQQSYDELFDLKRNWPGSVEDYALGSDAEGEHVFGEVEVINLRDPSKPLEAALG